MQRHHPGVALPMAVLISKTQKRLTLDCKAHIVNLSFMIADGIEGDPFSVRSLFDQLWQQQQQQQQLQQQGLAAAPQRQIGSRGE